jgi:hypothetical protein
MNKNTKISNNTKPFTIKHLHLPFFAPPSIRCVLICQLDVIALDVEGVFRVPGSARQVGILRDHFKQKNNGQVITLADEQPYTVCSLLSDYLRSEEPIMTYELADQWIAVTGTFNFILLNTFINSNKN